MTAADLGPDLLTELQGLDAAVQRRIMGDDLRELPGIAA